MDLRLKKAAAIFAVAGTLALCGCKANLPFVQRTPSLDGSYTVKAEITFDKLKAKADVTKSNGDWEFRFTEPKQLNGLSVKLGESGYSASLGGLTFSADNNSVYSAVPQIVAKAVGLLSGGGSSAKSENGVLTFDKELDGKRVTVTANEKTGELISLKSPHHRLSVNFSEQRAYTPEPDTQNSSQANALIVPE